jgi:hypothetical protein
MRRSNPDYLRGKILDCFAPLAMTAEADLRQTFAVKPGQDGSPRAQIAET